MALLPLLVFWKRRLESCGVEVLPDFERRSYDSVKRHGPEKLIAEAFEGFARDLRLQRAGEYVTGLPNVEETLVGLDLAAACWLQHWGIVGTPPPAQPPPKRIWSLDDLPFLGKPEQPDPPDPGGPASAWPAERIAAVGRC